MTNAEKFVYAVYKNKSFSKAAQEMFVSQPSLSATIKKHETKLGYQIFKRNSLPVTLTPEGEIYIEHLHEMAELERNLSQRLAQLRSTSSKTISIGGSKSASFQVIPKLCKEFHNQFPDVHIKIDVGEHGHTNILYDKLTQGKLDVVIGTNINSNDFNTIPLMKEKYMVVVRKDYPGVEKLYKYSLSYDEVLTGSYPHEKEISDYSLFKNIRVLRPGTNSKAREIFSDFLQSTPEPYYTITNFRRLHMHYYMMMEGLAAALMPQCAIIEKGYDTKKVCCFVISAKDNTRNIILAHKKNTQPSFYAEQFISIAKNMYNK